MTNDHMAACRDEKGFTLIEILVVLSIIGVLATLAVTATNEGKRAARDGKRLGDVSHVQTALDLYYADNRSYPPGAGLIVGGTDARSLCDTGWSAIPCAGTVYMLRASSAPSINDGACSAAENAYVYTQAGGGANYALTFCTGKAVGSLPEGIHTADANGIR
jgi:prepilin-type N-terminal cleavage/methylation domain-containing protein